MGAGDQDLIGVLWFGVPLVQSNVLGVPWLLAAVLALLAVHEALAPLSSFIGLGQSQAARNRINQLLPMEHTQPVATEEKARLQRLFSCKPSNLAHASLGH